jgi:hypothetical protein
MGAEIVAFGVPDTEGKIHYKYFPSVEGYSVKGRTPSLERAASEVYEEEKENKIPLRAAEVAHNVNALLYGTPIRRAVAEYIAAGVEPYMRLYTREQAREIALKMLRDYLPCGLVYETEKLHGEFLRTGYIPDPERLLEAVNEGGADSAALAEWVIKNAPVYNGANAAEVYAPYIAALNVGRHTQFTKDNRAEDRLDELVKNTGGSPPFTENALSALKQNPSPESVLTDLRFRWQDREPWDIDALNDYISAYPVRRYAHKAYKGGFATPADAINAARELSYSLAQSDIAIFRGGDMYDVAMKIKEFDVLLHHTLRY